MNYLLGVTARSPEIVHYTRTLEPFLIFILFAFITLDLLCGFVYRVLLLKNVHRTGWFTRPINIMIVLDESVKFLGCLSWTFTVVFSVILPHPLYHYTGYDFCRIVMWLTALGHIHSFIGGFGIALLRMLFIRFPSKLKLGRNVTALIISFFALAHSVKNRKASRKWILKVAIQQLNLQFSSPKTVS